VSTVADKGIAPGVKLTSANAFTWQFQWAEWEEGNLTGGQLWDQSNVTPLFTGDITAGGGEWPNPIVTWTSAGAAVTSPQSTKIGTLVPPISDMGTSAYPSTIGDLIYYPSITGPGKETATSTVNWLEYKREYDTYNTAKATFESAKTSYNTLKDAYNLALKNEKARKNDLFKSIFDPVVVVPTRPCPPDQPGDWTGLDFKWLMTGTGNTWAEWTAANKAAKFATFTTNS